MQHHSLFTVARFAGATLALGVFGRSSVIVHFFTTSEATGENNEDCHQDEQYDAKVDDDEERQV